MFSTRLLPGTLFLGTGHGEETSGSKSQVLSRLSPELKQTGPGGALGETRDSRGTVSLSPKKKCHSVTSLSWKARTGHPKHTYRFTHKNTYNYAQKTYIYRFTQKHTYIDLHKYTRIWILPDDVYDLAFAKRLL